jgi:hypothetical protein
LGRVFHVEGVERLMRNARLKPKTPEQFNSSLRGFVAATAWLAPVSNAPQPDRAATIGSEEKVE